MDNPHNLSQRTHQMFALIEKSQKSQLSQIAFCRQEDLPLSTFTYWLKKYRQFKQTAGATQDFIPLQTDEMPLQEQRNRCEIEFPDGVIIRISGI